MILLSHTRRRTTARILVRRAKNRGKKGNGRAKKRETEHRFFGLRGSYRTRPSHSVSFSNLRNFLSGELVHVQRKARLLVRSAIFVNQAFAGHFVEKTDSFAHLGFGIRLFGAAEHFFDACAHHRAVMTIMLILTAALPDTLNCRLCVGHLVFICSA